MSLRPRPCQKVIRIPLLIVCEGWLENSYFMALTRHLRVRERYALDIRCSRGGRHPKVLELAKRKSDGRETWCIFDVESDGEKAKVQDTIEKCHSFKFHVGLSNPCFNVWALAHLQAMPTGPTTPDQSLRCLKAALGGKLEERNVDWVLERILGGNNFANIQSASDHIRCFLPTDYEKVFANNPSTSVGSLVERLINGT